MIQCNTSDSDFVITQQHCGQSGQAKLSFGPLQTDLNSMLEAGFRMTIQGTRRSLGNYKQCKSVFLTRHSTDCLMTEIYTVGKIDKSHFTKYLYFPIGSEINSRSIDVDLSQHVIWCSRWGVGKYTISTRVTDFTRFNNSKPVEPPQDPWEQLQQKYPPVKAKQRVKLMGNMTPIEWLRAELKENQC